MSSDDVNPYASPNVSAAPIPPVDVDPAALKKMETIIKDAGQFWLAILICLLCSGLGMIIIGPWYAARLVQWNSLAKQHPMLLDRNVPRGSLAQRFQSAKTKLIIGISFGVLILLLAVVLLVSAIVAARAAAP